MPEAPSHPTVTPDGFETVQGDQEMAALTALSALLGLISGVGFLAPIVCWLIFRDRDKLCDEVGRVQSNFQISWLIWGGLLGIVGFILILVTFGLGIVLLIPLAAAFSIVYLVLIVVSGVKASQGIVYRPPLRIRFFAERQ